MAKLTTEEFLKKAQAVHGDKYDYSQVIYEKNDIPVVIICPKHGEFLQKPNKHLIGHGCKLCAIEHNAERYSLGKNEFVKRAKAIHHDFYDYSKVVYINANTNTNIEIRCPLHGKFTQTPSNHLRSGGCPICVRQKRKERLTIWSEDYILTEARKYKTYKELRTLNPKLYSAAKKRKINFPFLEKSYHDYTFEEIYQCAKKYTYKKDFYKNKPAMYSVALKKGWIKVFEWFKIPEKFSGDMTLNNHLIYAYEKKDLKIAYVGLTNNLKRRHYEHSSTWKGHQHTVVYKFFTSLGMIVPQPIVIESGLTPEESQIAENKWVEHYKQNGWSLLNTAETGAGISSLGSYTRLWDYASCKEEAKKYSSVSDFIKGARGTYAAALSNGWIEEFYPNKQQALKRTKENFLFVAHQYQTTGEFIKEYPSMYQFGLKKGWLKECSWLKRGHQISIWTFEACLAEAKKYKTYSEFIVRSPNAHRAMNRNGYREEIKKFFNSK